RSQCADSREQAEQGERRGVFREEQRMQEAEAADDAQRRKRRRRGVTERCDRRDFGRVQPRQLLSLALEPADQCREVAAVQASRSASPGAAGYVQCGAGKFEARHISMRRLRRLRRAAQTRCSTRIGGRPPPASPLRSVRRWTGEACRARASPAALINRKSTRLNSSHVKSSYAVFCLKKKKEKTKRTSRDI